MYFCSRLLLSRFWYHVIVPLYLYPFLSSAAHLSGITITICQLMYLDSIFNLFLPLLAYP